MNARLVLYGIVVCVLALSWAATCVIYRAAEMGDLVAPLELRSFDDLEVVTVGTGNELENPTRLGPVTAVGLDEVLYLVDAGRGVAEALRAASIPVDQPDTLLLTGLAAETSVGVDDLWLTGWRVGRESPLRVVGPPGTAALVAGLQAAHAGALQIGASRLGLPAEGAAIEAIEVESEWSERRGRLELRAERVDGPAGPGLAWHFESVDLPRLHVVITPAGGDPEALVQAARNADLWVHEAIYVPSPEEAEASGVTLDAELLERDARLHTSLLQVGQLAADAGVGHLVLTRMRPPPMLDVQVTGFLSQRFDGEISVAEDGDSFSP